MRSAELGRILPVAPQRRVWASLRQHAARHRGRVLAVALLFLAGAGLGLVMPASLGRIVDAVSAGEGIASIALWVAGVLAGAIGAALVTLWGARILVGLVQDVLAELREDVFAAAMRLPVRSVDDAESADLISRVTGDVDAVSEAGGNVVPALLSAGFAIAVSLAALAVLHPGLALAGLASVPCYVLGTRAFLRRSRIVFREVREREAARSQAVLEAVNARDTLIALNEHEHASAVVAERAEAAIRVQITGVQLRNRLFRSINGGEAAGLLAILATGFALHAQGAITVGMVTTAALVFHRLFDPIGQLIFALDDIQRATIGLARLVGVIDLAGPARAAGAAAPGGPARPAELAGPRRAPGLELHEVSFVYPGTDRGVTNVSFRVAPGTTTALVGTSGSGKSTIARLIAAHDEPAAGEIRWDPVAEPYVISQEIHLFRGGVAANLRLAAPDASLAQMRAALAAVGADWALELLADPLAAASPETAPPETAPELDDGQIQQLAIARAMLADPAVVILDEATADVGLQHRPAVEAAMGALRVDRTVVLIAHQLQQAASATQILVCADGRIVQRGTHASLLATEGPYRHFWAAQGAPARPARPARPDLPDVPTTPEETEHP